MTAVLDHHVWKTADGRHVPDGHREAAVLEYAAGDPVPKHVLDELDELEQGGQAPRAKAEPKAVGEEGDKSSAKRAPAKRAAAKRAPAPANKAAKSAGDK